ncbi:MAG: carbon-nitrogen hydrolase family protein [Acidimicrobiales bacterium]
MDYVTRPFVAAAVQTTTGVDAQANVATALSLVERAADAGATYVQLPEYVTYYGSSSGFAAAAEDVPGPTTARFAALAASRGVAIHVGSLLERTPDPERFFNTGVLIDRVGDVVALYRKAHLFDVDVADQAPHRESDAIVAGDELVVGEVEGAAIGMSICFDLRFPEVYRRLALAGARVLTVPSAFTAATGRAHWETLVRARAIENHAFVVAAARAGAANGAPATWGHSMIVGPWGEVLADASDVEGVIVAELDLGDVARRRAQIDVLALRRPDLYGP